MKFFQKKINPQMNCWIKKLYQKYSEVLNLHVKTMVHLKPNAIDLKNL